MTNTNVHFLQRSRTAVLIAALLVPTALWAQSEAPSRTACDQAKRDAQFLRQMQLTDGDANPFVELPIRTDCRNKKAE